MGNYKFLLLYLKTMFVDFYTVTEMGMGMEEEIKSDNENCEEEEWIAAIDRIKQSKDPELIKNLIYFFLQHYFLNDIEIDHHVKRRARLTLKGLDKLTLL